MQWFSIATGEVHLMSVFLYPQESACVKVTAALSMWDLCMEKGSAELEQFQKVHRLISDQLFSDFVSDVFLSYACLCLPKWLEKEP